MPHEAVPAPVRLHGLVDVAPASNPLTGLAAGDVHRAKLSTGGRFKQRDPAVSVDILEARLELPTPTVYIGKGDRLQRRISQLLRFGAGETVGHWGGRYLWQLEDSGQLLVAWRTDPDPIGAESELLRDFSAQFGALPFANLRH